MPRAKRTYVNLSRSKELRLASVRKRVQTRNLGERRRWWVKDATGAAIYRIEHYSGGSKCFVLAQVDGIGDHGDGNSPTILKEFPTLHKAYRYAKRLFAQRKPAALASIA